jgi:hypothetical protein
MSVLILLAGLVILLNVLLFTAGAAIGLFGCAVDAARAIGSTAAGSQVSNWPSARAS